MNSVPLTTNNAVEGLGVDSLPLLSPLANSANSESTRNSEDEIFPPHFPDSLPDLAARIHTSYGTAMRHARDWIREARACGDLLIAAKKRVKHGEWLPWLNVHFPGSADTAENWMKIAHNWWRLSEDVSRLTSVDAALKILREEKKKPNLLSYHQQKVAELQKQLPDVTEGWRDVDLEYFARSFGNVAEGWLKEVRPIIDILSAADQRYEDAVRHLASDHEGRTGADNERTKEIAEALRSRRLGTIQVVFLLQILGKRSRKIIPRWYSRDYEGTRENKFIPTYQRPRFQLVVEDEGDVLDLDPSQYLRGNYVSG